MVKKATKVMAGVLIMLGCVSAASAQDGVIRVLCGCTSLPGTVTVSLPKQQLGFYVPPIAEGW